MLRRGSGQWAVGRWGSILLRLHGSFLLMHGTYYLSYLVSSEKEGGSLFSGQQLPVVR